jgi:predicted DNA-binding WGR domain protein
MKHYLEFIDEKSNKFWEITQEGNSFTARYGKIGSDGQTQTKSFTSEETAQKEAEKLLKEKLKKGYAEPAKPGEAINMIKPVKENRDNTGETPSFDITFVRKNIQDVYGFDMPPDFYRFIEFCGVLYSLGIVKKAKSGEFNDSINALFETAFDISLGEIFDLLRSNFQTTYFDPVSNQRYYDDPPEFFTILCGHTDGLHWGYWVDDPFLPFRVCHYYHSDTYEFQDDGETLFEALQNHINDLLEDDLEPKRKKILKQIRPLLAKYLPEQKAKREPTMAYYDLGILIPKEKYKKPENKLYSTLVENYIKSKIPENSELEPLIRETESMIKAGFAGAAYALGKRLWLNSANRKAAVTLLEKSYTSLGRVVLQKSLKKADDFRTKCDEENKPKSHNR